jgi:hypothetical protein
MTTTSAAVAAVPAIHVDVAAKRAAILEQFCTASTPADVRDLLILAMDGEVPVQRRLTLSAAGKRMCLLLKCKFVGGGIDGFVLRSDRELRKICEVLEGHQREAACREIINGTIARLRGLPYIALLERWNTWDGEATNKQVNNNLSRRINGRLRQIYKNSPPHILDIIEHVPDQATRTSIQTNWLKSRGQFPPADVQIVEDCYVRHKIERICDAYDNGKLLPHSYIILQQQDAGNCTFYSQFDYPQNSDSIMRPEQWPKFRAQMLFLVHQQWVLQKKAGFRHRDLQPQNTVMRFADRMPPEYAKMWLPERTVYTINGQEKVRFGAKLPKITELGLLVPVIIDLSRSIFDNALSMQTLALKPGAETNARIQSLVDPRRRSRTGDLRRLGIYLAFRVCSALEASQCFRGLSASTNHPLEKLDEWITKVTQAFDWRFIVVTMNLCLPPIEWIEFIVRKGAKASAPPEKNFGQVSESFRVFVDKLLKVQRILQSLLAVVGLATRGDRPLRQEAARRVAKQRTGITRCVEDLIKDLNPYSDYMESESHRTREGDWQLPEKIIEWDVWTM